MPKPNSKSKKNRSKAVQNHLLLYLGFFVVCIVPLIFWVLVTSLGFWNTVLILVPIGVASVYIRLYTKNLFKNLFKNFGKSNELAKTIFIAASEVMHAGKNEISEAELAALVSCVRRIPEATLKEYDVIVQQFYRHSSTPWTVEIGRKVKPLHCYAVMQSAIDVASKSPALYEAQEKVLKKIGADLGYEASTVSELLRANKAFQGEQARQRQAKQQRARAKRKEPSDTHTTVPNTIVHALRVMKLRPTATWKEIKRQYKKLAMRYHPDRAEDKVTSTKKFKEVGDAYRFLKEQLGKK